MEIEIVNISKSFGNLKALDSVSTKFINGKFYGVLGPNGAGKTTLIKAIIGQLSTDEGDIIWMDFGEIIDTVKRKRTIGLVPQSSVLDPFLSVSENLITRGKLYGMSYDSILEKIGEMDEYLSISHLLKRQFRVLSGGQKRRVDIARALLHGPKLLILDEPTTGIDPEGRKELWSAISRLKDNKNITVILVTHYLEEMEGCDNILVLINGNVKYDGSLESFIDNNSNLSILANVNNRSGIKNLLDRNNVKYDIQDNNITLPYKSKKEKIDILRILCTLNDLNDISINSPQLEDVYIDLLKKEGVENV